MQLSIGAQETLRVKAHEKRSGHPILEVVIGECYRFAVPEGQTWKDFFGLITCGPEGFSYRLFRKHLRVPSKPYFYLCGLVDDGTDVHTFAIGKQPLHGWKAPATGKLYLFANDVPGFYWNNRGEMIVIVERLG